MFLKINSWRQLQDQAYFTRCVCGALQTWTSVKQGIISAMKTPTATTRWDSSRAPANQASSGMASIVEVNKAGQFL